MLGQMMYTWNKLSLLHKAWGIIAAMLVVAFGIWTLSPLFYNRVVNEELPASAAQPAMQASPPAATTLPASTAVASDAQAAMQPAIPVATSVLAPTAAVDAQPAIQPTVVASLLASGTFVDGVIGHHAKGRAVVYAPEGNERLLRLEDLNVTNGPDLFVVLSSNDNPKEQGIGEGYLQLQALKGNQGSQNYTLGADADLKAYKSVVIWCRSFNVVFGYAPLG